MKRKLTTLVMVLSFLGLFPIAQPADAGTIGDFFKSIGNTMFPKNRSKTRRTGKKDAVKADETSPVAEPAQATVRSASAAPPANGTKRDLPYGIPVPNRQGLVTSPYAPKQGFVDVSTFPSGAEVTDPYTGKVFLTP